MVKGNKGSHSSAELIFSTMVTGSLTISRCSHRVTAKFRQSQIVASVVAVNSVLMGETTL